MNRPIPPDHISSAHLAGKDGARVRMNIVAHQEKEKNEETKMGREETDFKEAACCPSVVIRGAEQRKNGLCKGSARSDWDSQEGQQPFLPNSNGAGDCTTTLRRLLIRAV